MKKSSQKENKMANTGRKKSISGKSTNLKKDVVQIIKNVNISFNLGYSLIQ